MSKVVINVSVDNEHEKKRRGKRERKRGYIHIWDPAASSDQC